MESPPPLSPDSEAIRKRYLNHEASVQAIGSLYLLGSVFSVGIGVARLLGFGDPAGTMLLSAFLIAFGAAEGWIGWYLRKLDPRSKIAAIMLAAIGLFAFPIGTIINAYVLYLLVSVKGKYVFSPEYRAVITATPHIRYKMSFVVWGFIWLVIALLLLGVIAAMYAKY